jgi:ParB-like chromosome segregation protein Spo0J
VATTTASSGALQPLDLLFVFGDPLLALGQRTRRIRDSINLGRQPLNRNLRLKKGQVCAFENSGHFELFFGPEVSGSTEQAMQSKCHEFAVLADGKQWSFLPIAEGNADFALGKFHDRQKGPIMAKQSKQIERPDESQANQEVTNMETRKIRIDDIKVVGNHRPIVTKKLRVITDSIAKIGLKTPITVRASKKGFVLIAGRHRLEAAKSLGWREINCFVMVGDKIERKLWRIAENLHCAGLTALQRAEFIEEWEKLIKERVKVGQSGGRQPEDKGLSKVAKQLGTTREHIRRSRAVAALSAKAKKAAEVKGIADNQSALLEVAKEPTAKAQVEKVYELAKRKRAGKRDLSPDEVKQLTRVKRTFDDAHEHKSACIAASERVREEFYKTVLAVLDTDEEWE